MNAFHKVIACFCLWFPMAAAEGDSGNTSIKRAAALPGECYRLKEGSPKESLAVVKEFVDAGWDAGKLESLSKSDCLLYGTSFYLPLCSSSVVPSCFMMNDGQSGGVLVLYKGVVEAPVSGRFRFVGMGDDMLLVRFGEKLVLKSGTMQLDELGATEPRSKKTASRRQKEEKVRVPGAETWNSECGGLSAGEPFHVEKGRTYEMQVLYADAGGKGGFCLLMQRLDQKPLKVVDVEDEDALDIFRLGSRLPDKQMFSNMLRRYMQGQPMEWILFREDSLIWHSRLDAADSVLEEKAQTDARKKGGAPRKKKKKDKKLRGSRKR